MKYAIGAIIGILIYHYWPHQVQDMASQAGAIVHEGAKKAVEITAQ
jgi:hypothetical protein